MRRLGAATTVAAMALVASAVPAFAAKGSHEQVRVDETIADDVVCGIDVSTHLVITGPVNVTSEGRLTDNSRVRLTFTNAAGDWLVNDISGQFRQVVTENADGTIISIETHRGNHERLRSADGIEAAFDRGQIVFRNVVDLNDPEDPTDDELISSDILQQAGPHPDADSDFELFCEVVERVLG